MSADPKTSHRVLNSWVMRVYPTRGVSTVLCIGA